MSSAVDTDRLCAGGFWIELGNAVNIGVIDGDGGASKKAFKDRAQLNESIHVEHGRNTKVPLFNKFEFVYYSAPGSPTLTADEQSGSGQGATCVTGFDEINLDIPTSTNQPERLGTRRTEPRCTGLDVQASTYRPRRQASRCDERQQHRGRSSGL
ncbi:hypothetical protein THAOC_31169, partial [Thalassiosira oceanica]